MSLEKQFFKILNFIEENGNLINCHLVDFLTEDLWDKCLPDDIKLYAEEIGHDIVSETEQFDDADEIKNSKLYSFLRNVTSLKLDKCPGAVIRSDILKTINYEPCKTLQSELMKVKKWYEVDIFTKTIVWLDKDKSSIIIDAGAGKGYSSVHLSSYYKLPVLAIECSNTNQKGAIHHLDLVNKKNKQNESKVCYVTEQIDESTDFLKMLEHNFPNFYKEKRLMMTTLHGCGSLSDCIIKAFLNVKDFKYLCMVPCCYHLATKSLFQKCEFSKNSRMLAQQSVERIKQKTESISPSLYYRAVLQVILKHLGIGNLNIGRGAPSSNFITYVKWALKKVDTTKVLSDEEIEDFYKRYESEKWKFDFFQLLRIHIAPVVEAAIILDKVLFMQNANICSDIKIAQLFDPVISPRSWAIIATK